MHRIYNFSPAVVLVAVREHRDPVSSGRKALHSVEHFLAQSPQECSQWLAWFPDEGENRHWTHRLLNLIVISSRKNARAFNYEFKRKKREQLQGACRSGLRADHTGRRKGGIDSRCTAKGGPGDGHRTGGRGWAGGRVPARGGSAPAVRVALDTNVIVSGLNFPCCERMVLELSLRKRFELFLSWLILSEVSGVLTRKFGWDQEGGKRSSERPQTSLNRRSGIGCWAESKLTVAALLA